MILSGNALKYGREAENRKGEGTPEKMQIGGIKNENRHQQNRRVRRYDAGTEA